MLDKIKILNKNDLNNYKVIDADYELLKNIIRSEFVEEIGFNKGFLGWNWTAYQFKGTNCVILNSYRNSRPAWRANFSKIENELKQIDNECVDLYKKTDEEKAEILKRLQELVNR
ncbi:TPA: hypothetical protein ACUME3_001941 [Haemophilus influenzae]